MLLQYEIGIDSSKLKRQLRGVEGELVALQKRINSASAVSAIKTGRTAAKAVTGGTGTTLHPAVRARITEQERMEIRAAQRAGNARLREIKREEHERTRVFLAQKRQEEQLANMQRRFVLRKSALQTQWKQENQARWSNVARGAVGGARNLVGLGVGAAGLGGSFAALNAVSKQMESGALFTELANKSVGIQGETRTREELRDSIEAQSVQLGEKSGLGARAVGQGLSNLTGKAGQLEVGQALMPYLVDLTDATGAAIEDVGRTGGQIIQALTTRGLSQADMIGETQRILGAMAGQAKVGSIEFSDLAQQMSKVMAATAGFKGNVGDLAETMGAVAQLSVAGGASSPEEQMTAIMRFRDDMVANAKRFQAQDIDVFSDKSHTQLRDPMAVIGDVLRKTKGDLTKIDPLFDIRASKAFAPFQQASVAAGGGKAGQEAVLDLLASIRGASMKPEEVAASAAFRRSAPDRQLDIAAERFNRAVGSRLVPVVTDLVPQLERLIPVAAKVAEGGANAASWILENPWKGVGVAAGAGIAKEVASAGIATMLQGPFGKVAGQATLLAGALVAGISIIDAFAKADDDRSKRTVEKGIGDLNVELSARGKVRAGHSFSPDMERMLLGIRSSKLEEARALRTPDAAVSSFPGAMLGQSAKLPVSAENLTKASAAEADAARIGALLSKASELHLLSAQASQKSTAALDAVAKKLDKAGNGASRGTPMIARPAK